VKNLKTVLVYSLLRFLANIVRVATQSVSTRKKQSVSTRKKQSVSTRKKHSVSTRKSVGAIL